MVISEIAIGGPGGYHDNFIEIANWGDEPVDVSGWELFRCTGTGSVASAPQNTLQGTIGAGERWLFAPESDQSTIADADVQQRYKTSLASESYGALLSDSSGEDVDAVAVQFPGTANQACGEGAVLANTTDSAAGESFQRTQDTDDNAADFVPAKRTAGAIEVGEAAEEKTPEYTHEEPRTTGGATVGSSVTITPLGILLSLLGALGAVGLIAALLNYMGINLQEYFEQFLDMLP